MGAGEGGTAIVFGFGFISESPLAINSSKQAMKIGNLRRKLNRFLQFHLRIG